MTMVDRELNLILIGAPGSGKGTQSKRLLEKFGIPQVSTGDILRRAVQEGTSIGLEAKRFMDLGELVPDQLLVDLIRELLAQPAYKAGWVLDGYPRTLAQAEALDSMLLQLGKQINHVIVLDVPDELLIERIVGRRSCPVCGNVHHLKFSPPREAGKCDRCGGTLVQRGDDSEEKVRVRQGAFRAQTTEVISYYEQKSILHRIHGERTQDAVFGNICAILEDGT